MALGTADTGLHVSGAPRSLKWSILFSIQAFHQNRVISFTTHPESMRRLALQNTEAHGLWCMQLGFPSVPLRSLFKEPITGGRAPNVCWDYCTRPFMLNEGFFQLWPKTPNPSACLRLCQWSEPFLPSASFLPFFHRYHTRVLVWSFTLLTPPASSPFILHRCFSK